jgi:oligopeptide/dipeptide ABC transporter ATP-binding protein
LTATLEVKNLKTYFFTEEGVVKAVDDVSFSVEQGKTLGLVGESGCGKSVTAMSIARLVSPPGRIVGGQILLNGRDLLSLSEQEMRRARGAQVSMVFQEPMTALNPVLEVGYQIAEAVLAHENVSKREAWVRAVEAMKAVSIPDPEKRAKDYPHHLSGGMRQRIMIAMALVCRPALVVADEPTTALDVTIQAQILELLDSLREQYHLSLILISHDLGVIAEVAETVAVMYAGKIVEIGPAMDIFHNPKHPYTEGLLRSIPHLGSSAQKKDRLSVIDGMVPNLLHLPDGCSFAPRCYKKTVECTQTPIDLLPNGPIHERSECKPDRAQPVREVRCIHA